MIIFVPPLGTVFELWCNGNTADFGSVVLGSSPGSSTKKGLLHLKKSFFVTYKTSYYSTRPRSFCIFLAMSVFSITPENSSAPSPYA